MTEQATQDFLAAVGGEIASWRKRRRLSRADLATLAGLSETTIGRIERGGTDARVAATHVWRICRALDLTLADLVRRAQDAYELSAPARKRETQA